MSTFENNPALQQFFKDYKRININEINNTKTSYIQALKGNDICDKDKNNQIDDFIKEFIIKIDNVNKSDKEIDLSFLWMYFQYLKMKKVAEYSNKHDKEKDIITMKKNDFVGTISRYFKNKNIIITDNGELIIQKKNISANDIDPINLSSGEKQLLIAFATLYFGFSEKKDGVCIIDEPESSLNISWQQSLVSDLLKENDKVQYILATHSPEIVSNYSDNLNEMVS